MNLTHKICFAVTIIIILISTTSYAFDDDCGEADGSTYFSACIASKHSNDAQNEIDVLYSKLQRLDKSEDMIIILKLLKESQEAWLIYKDSMCTLEQEHYGGINSVSYGKCSARLTSFRLEELRELASTFNVFYE